MRARLGLVASLVLAGCPRARTATTASDGGAAPRAVDAALNAGDGVYRVITVTGAGRIAGRVVWEGAPEAVAPIAVPPSGSPQHCGHEQPWPALAVSASGGVADAVVAIAAIAAGAAVEPTVVTIDQAHCRYTPHLVAMGVGGRLRFTNSDTGVLHNVHGFYGYGDDDTWFNSASPYGVPFERAVTRAGVHRVACDAGHPWMLAYVWAFPHPYFAVTDAEGRFAMPNVPPGTYEVVMWHEGWRRDDATGIAHPHPAPPVERRQRVTVTAGGEATARFAMRAGM